MESLALGSAARGHDVTVLTTDALDQRNRIATLEETVAGLRLLRRRNVSAWLRGRYNLSTPLGMRKTAERILPGMDILHIHEFRTAENLLVTPVARELGIPIVLSAHGTLTQATGRSMLKRSWDRLLSPAVAGRIDHVLALTPKELADARDLWRRFGRRAIPTRFSVLPNGVDPAAYAKLPDDSDFRQRCHLDDVPTVLFLGRLQRRKGVDVLLKAFQAAQIPRSQLLIVGPDEGMAATLTRLAAGDRRIVLTGYLEGRRRLQALAAADILALPATGEGLPMAVLEAMAAGLPVLLSPGCNLPEVAEAGAGFVAAPTVDAFADKLRPLLTDGSLRDQMGMNARQLAVGKYAWDGVCARLEAVYESLLSRPAT